MKWKLVPVEPAPQQQEAVVPFPEHLFADGTRSPDDRQAMERAAMADRMAFTTQYRKAIAAAPSPGQDVVERVGHSLQRAWDVCASLPPIDLTTAERQHLARAVIAALGGEG